MYWNGMDFGSNSAHVSLVSVADLQNFHERCLADGRVSQQSNLVLAHHFYRLAEDDDGTGESDTGYDGARGINFTLKLAAWHSWDSWIAAWGS